ncbi:MAG: MerR family transcriptional regulator [Candidatus Tectimicrobiota bacterium]
MSSYNVAMASRITGLTPRQIIYLDEQNVVKPSASPAMGRGYARLYDFVDLVQLRVLKALRDQGLSLQRIRRALAYLRKHFPTDKPLAHLRFLTDGETVFVLVNDSDRRAIVDALRQGQVVHAIALGDLMNEVRGRMEALSVPRKARVRLGGQRFEVVIERDTEAGGYVAECPAMPGCASQGDTLEETIANIREAIAGVLEARAAREKAPRKAGRKRRRADVV